MPRFVLGQCQNPVGQFVFQSKGILLFTQFLQQPLVFDGTGQWIRRMLIGIRHVHERICPAAWHIPVIVLHVVKLIFVILIEVIQVVINHILNIVAQRLPQRGEVLACLQLTVYKQKVLAVFAELIFYQRHVVGVFLQYILRQSKALVGLDAAFLCKVNGTIYPIVSLLVAAFLNTLPFQRLHEEGKFVRSHPQVIKRIFHTQAKGIHKITPHTDIAPRMSTSNHDMSQSYFMNGW